MTLCVGFFRETAKTQAASKVKHQERKRAGRASGSGLVARNRTLDVAHIRGAVPLGAGLHWQFGSRFRRSSSAHSTERRSDLVIHLVSFPPEPGRHRSASTSHSFPRLLVCCVVFGLAGWLPVRDSCAQNKKHS